MGNCCAAAHQDKDLKTGMNIDPSLKGEYEAAATKI